MLVTLNQVGAGRGIRAAESAGGGHPGGGCTLDPQPYTLHPSPSTLNPTH